MAEAAANGKLTLKGRYEIVTDDQGGRMFVCSDTDVCSERQALGFRGPLNSEAAE